MDLDKAVQTQIENIQKRSGKSLAELSKIIKGSGLAKHGQIRDMLKRDLGMGHGDANTLTHIVLKSDGQSAAKEAGLSADAVLDGIYTAKKAELRPIHEALMARINKFGKFEIAPKKGYVSLRRKKQFAMIGPATNSRVDLGINAKDLPAGDRLIEEPPGRMCQYKVKLTEASQVDDEVTAWLRAAFDSAG